MNKRRIGYFEGRIDAYRGVLDLIEDVELDCYLMEREKSKALFVKLLRKKLERRISSNCEELEQLDTEGETK